MRMLLSIVVMISAIMLVVTVLLHSAKGEGLGGIGGQARMFSSSRDMEAGLTKVTGIIAAVFMGASLILSIFY